MRDSIIAILGTLAVVALGLALIVHKYGRTSASLILMIILGIVGLILGAVAIGVWWFA